MQYKTFALLAVLMACGLNLLGDNSLSGVGLNNPSSFAGQQWVDSVMSSLTLRQKVAQLFMVAAYSNKDSMHVNEIAALVKEEGIGGLCFFQGGPVRQANITNYYQSLSKVPLLISMDAEWGLGMRLDSTISYPRQMMLGATDDNSLVYRMGADIALQLKRLGVHLNFAPVVDVNNNPANPVINTRAFGEDKESVSQKGLAYMLGLQDNGILACAKHFPGHGDTGTDSHYALPLLNHSSERIDSIELYPFKLLVNKGVASVMVGHMEIPSLEANSNVASSLSYSIVTTKLKEELGFNGLVITDAMNMKGVSDFYKPVDVNYMALKAGNDIILFPSEVSQSITKIEQEVNDGFFPLEEIERRCRKIIEAKYMVGLHRAKPVSSCNLVADLNKPSSQLLARQIAEHSVTLLSNSSNLIPFQRLDTLKIAYLEVGKGMGNPFREQMELYAPVTTIPIDANAPEDSLREVYFSLTPFNMVIVGYHAITNRPNRDFGVTPHMAQFLYNVSNKRKTVISLFGSPYVLSRLVNPTNASAVLLSYDNSTVVQNITAQALFGGTSISGRLPVSASSDFTQNMGVNTDDRIRLKYSIPEELGLKSKYFSAIDSLAIHAIKSEAVPGMQILVAQKGVVVYNKCFGSHIYDEADLKVTNQSVYDVASVTKISATLPLLMDLYSDGRLLLNDTLGKHMYIPKGSNYGKIVVSDMLLHQSGLAAWIPFYQRTLSSLWPRQVTINGKFSEEYPYQLSRNRFLSRYSHPSRKFYRNYFSFSYPHEVAKGLYAAEGIKDSIFTWILQTPLDRPGTYKYSDLGFMLLHRAAGNILGMPQEEYLSKRFYSSLGMYNTMFNPLERISPERIAPTENDVVFRKQLVWGYVHDPAAAMMGGIAGHAGLFSTANDLAKLMQMYLNKGHYGGIRYFPESTIELFTSCPNCSNGVRRGLGFDKPETDANRSEHVSKKASPLSYGHTGFTGIYTWVDPQYDLVYIFVSNRVFPDSDNNKLSKMNIRTQIQDYIYDAVLDAN